MKLVKSIYSTTICFLFTVSLVVAQCENTSNSNELEKIPCIGREHQIVIVICSYNNEHWCKWNLDSVFTQKYGNYKVIYIDDCSTDNTYELVSNYIQANNQTNRFQLIRNAERCGALANQYKAIHSCRDNDIIIILDGDDRFADDEVLMYINYIYTNPNVWLTYGQFKEHSSGSKGFCVAMPQDIAKNNMFREYVHIPSHLRTFYAGLFKQIRKKDLMYEGKFFQMCGDIAAMFPMIEMASKGHFKFISRILLDYNAINELNDHKVDEPLQRKLDVIIRAQVRYNPLEKLEFKKSYKRKKSASALLYKFYSDRKKEL